VLSKRRRLQGGTADRAAVACVCGFFFCFLCCVVCCFLCGFLCCVVCCFLCCSLITLLLPSPTCVVSTNVSDGWCACSRLPSSAGCNGCNSNHTYMLTPTLPYPTLPYPTLPYPTLPYPTLPAGCNSNHTYMLTPTHPTLPYPTCVLQQQSHLHAGARRAARWGYSWRFRVGEAQARAQVRRIVC